MRTISFFGTDYKVGVTMTSKVIAKQLGKILPDKKILLLHLDGNAGEGYGKCNISMDDIKASLMSNILSAKNLEDLELIESYNLFEIAGVRNYGSRKDYAPMHVGRLLSVIGMGDFDICIIDAGSDFNCALSVGAIMHSDTNILVTTQQETAKNRYICAAKPILSRLNITFDAILLNKYLDIPKLYTLEDLMEKYNINQAYPVLPMSKYSWQAEKDRDTLCSYGDKAYNEAAHSIAEKIAVKERLIDRIEILDNRSIKKKWQFSFLNGGKEENHESV